MCGGGAAHVVVKKSGQNPVLVCPRAFVSLVKIPALLKKMHKSGVGKASLYMNLGIECFDGIRPTTKQLLKEADKTKITQHTNIYTHSNYNANKKHR